MADRKLASLAACCTERFISTGKDLSSAQIHLDTHVISSKHGDRTAGWPVTSATESGAASFANIMMISAIHAPS
jgi:hypothetical protein